MSLTCKNCWAIFIPFFMTKCYKTQNFSFITCKGIDLLFVKPARPLTPGWVVIWYWLWPSGIYDMCHTEFWYFVTFQGLPETFHATNCDWLPSWKGCFSPWGPCNNVVRLGRIFGCWTDVESNAAYHGWVCHAGVMRRRDLSFFTLPSTLPIKQRRGFIQEPWMESTPQLPGSGCPDDWTIILVNDGSVEKVYLRYSSDFHNLRKHFGVQFPIAWIFMISGLPICLNIQTAWYVLCCNCYLIG